MSPMVVARTTFDIVSTKVVTLTRRVFSLTISIALAALVDPSAIEGPREKGQSVR